MSDKYEFVVRQSTVDLHPAEADSGCIGSTAIDVTNRLGRHETVMLRAVPGEGADEGWFHVDPAHQHLQTDKTLTVAVTIAVPPGTPAGTHRFRLGAYAESEPQQDYTLSQELTFEVPESKAPGLRVRWWMVAVAAVVVLAIAAGIVAVVVRAGGTEVDDFVGRPLDEARAAFGGTVLVFTDDGSDGAEHCVLLQSPGPGAESDQVAFYTTPCPIPSPAPAVPDVEDVCSVAPGFCAEVDAAFTPSEWPGARYLMVQSFVEAMTVPGVEAPTVVGLPLVEARSRLQEAGIEDWAELDDGGPDTACRDEDDQLVGRPVLLQHPFPGRLAAGDVELALVLTGCPDQASRPEDVAIDSFVDLDDYANIRAAVPDYVAALEADPALGPDFLGTPEMVAELDAMVDTFRHAFAVNQVPDVVGKRLEPDAVNLLAAVDLPVTTELGADDPHPGCEVGQFCIFYCQVSRVVAQSPDPGLRIADLPEDTEAVLTYDNVWETCRFGYTHELQASDDLEASFDDRFRD